VQNQYFQYSMSVIKYVSFITTDELDISSLSIIRQLVVPMSATGLGQNFKIRRDKTEDVGNVFMYKPVLV
jgi:hypothetical protein